MRKRLYTAASRVFFRMVPNVSWRIPTEEKTAYLTFDDGPFAGTTPILLDMLDRLDAKAAFFLIGDLAENEPTLVREILARGHQVGNHSYQHLDAWRRSSAITIADLEKGLEVLTEVVQRIPEIWRPPYGHVTPATLRWTRERSMRTVLWDTPALDYRERWREASKPASLFEPPVPGSIIVLHERPNMSQTWFRSLETRCQQMREAGWRFESLAS